MPTVRHNKAPHHPRLEMHEPTAAATTHDSSHHLHLSHLYDPRAVESDGKAAVREDELIRVLVRLALALVLLPNHAPDRQVVQVHLVPSVFNKAKQEQQQQQSGG